MIWFGESWGAPICDPETHGKTPVGKQCLYCGTPIEPEDNGIMMPLGHLDGSATLEAAHRRCFLDQLLPHGPDCERCRGLERDEHKMSCSYRKHGAKCDCPFGASMRRLLDPTMTVAEVSGIAKTIGLTLGTVLAIARKSVARTEALEDCQAAHNPGDDPGKRKAT